MGIAHDLTGQKFGLLQCLEINGRDSSRCATWLCQCECGNLATVRSCNLLNGTTKSCGCLQKVVASHNASIMKVKHNQCYTRLYRIWAHMKERCLNPNCKDYKNYGGRGITLCKEWHDFKPFGDWAMANGYRAPLTIERVNNNGNYEPSNCKWIPRSEQNKNRRGILPKELVTVAG